MPPARLLNEPYESAINFRNLSWPQFADEVGFVSLEFPSRYDFALSFSGSDRDIAEALFESLQENELEVFYDRNEQHRILAADVEEYLAPIYASDAQLVIETDMILVL